MELPRGAAKRLIRRAFAELKGDLLSLTRDHVEAILDLARARSRRNPSPGRDDGPGRPGRAGGGPLAPLPCSGPWSRLLLGGPGRYGLSTGWSLEVTEVRPPEKIPPDPGLAFMDLDKLSWPLEIRPVQEGDRIRPLGLGGSKKLSDLFIDRKVKRRERDRVPLVIQGK